MSTSTSPAIGQTTREFRHEAFLYADDDSFVVGTVAFLREGLAAREAALVVVSRRRIAMLKAALGDHVWSVQFADMAEVGSNPARIIPAWRDFVDTHERAGRGFRGIGEPIFPERNASELVECQHHESLLNVAFDNGPPWRLMCPYNVNALPHDVIAEARRSHPVLSGFGPERASNDYRGRAAISSPFDGPLSEPPVRLSARVFEKRDLSNVRAAVFEQAAGAGLDEDRREQLVVAVNEVATNSLRHGGGTGTLRMWTENGSLVCEVQDRGWITAPLIGRERPSLGSAGGRGLWMANQLCDLVQVRSSQRGTTIRLHMRRA